MSVNVEQVLQALEATLSADNRIRSNAEHFLSQLRQSFTSRLSIVLTQISLNQQIGSHLRQLSCLLLKSIVKQSWNDGDQIKQEDKRLIKQNIINGLTDQSNKVSTSICMTIAQIASYDYPESWPNLIDILLNSFNNSQPTSPGALGTLKCLSLVAENFGDDQIPTIFPNLVPYMLSIVSKEQYPEKVKAKALHVIRELVILLGTVSDQYHKQSIHLMQQQMGELLKLIVMLIQKHSSKCKELKSAALKIMLQLISYFSSLLIPFKGKILMSVYGSLSQEYDTYLKGVVQSDDIDEEYDSETGDSVSLSSLVSQILEVISTIVQKPQFTDDVKPNISALFYLVIGYLQMTNEDIHRFHDNANQYVGDEEDDYTFTNNARGEGQYLVQDIVSMFGGDCLQPMISSFQKRMQEVSDLLSSNNKYWWKLREAGLLAMESVSSFLVKSHAKKLFDLHSFIRTIIQQDMSSKAPIYLRARAVSFSSKCFNYLPYDIQKILLFNYLSFTGMSEGIKDSLVLILYSCRALGICAARCAKDSPTFTMISEHSETIIKNLFNILNYTDDSTIPIILQTIACVIKNNPHCLAQTKQTVISVLMNLLSKYDNDPEIPQDVIHVFDSMVKYRPSYELLKTQVVPSLIQFLTSSKMSQQPELIPRLLELLNLIVRHGQQNDMGFILQNCFAPVSHLILQSDDANILEEGIDFVRSIVYMASDALPSFKVSGNQNSIQIILKIVEKLLNPNFGESGLLTLGNLIFSIFLKLGSRLGDQILSQMMQLVVDRLESAENLTLIQTLILVFAQLINNNRDVVLQFLLSYKNGYGLKIVLEKWCDNQGNIFGRYEIKVTSLALLKLLLSGDQRLANIQVPVSEASNSTFTYQTRSKGPIEKKKVAFPIQAFSLIVDSYCKALDMKNEIISDDLADLLYGEDSDESDDGSDDEGNPLEKSVSQTIYSENDDEEDDTEDPFAKFDPVHSINLKDELSKGIQTLCKKYPQLLSFSMTLIGKKQQKILNDLLK